MKKLLLTLLLSTNVYANTDIADNFHISALAINQQATHQVR